MSPHGKPRRTDPRRRGAAASSAQVEARERQITLRGMRFHALIGILEHERTIPQPLEVDLTVDSVSGGGILDYRRLYDMVADIVANGPIDYLETVADRVAHAALEDGRVQHALVAVRKPHVALAGPLAYAEVVVRLGRDARDT
jgi:dihydroneopterin aldolase